jgi:pimeloyl-ACP methyl ester carboxylesterase
MKLVTSKDGTPIAYDSIGRGPALILIACALCSRLSWSRPTLAGLLADRLTVYNYDRRGRGDSGDSRAYAIDREIDDIEALIDAPTLAYDHTALLGEAATVPTDLAASVTAPALVLYGDASFPFMDQTAQTLSRVLPRARLCALAGQTHDVDPAAAAPALLAFIEGEPAMGAES